MARENYLTPKQIERLLRPINPAKVSTLRVGGRGMSYIAQHEVRAEMNRVFGFGRWSTDVIETAFMWEEQDENKRWNTCYRATVKVTVYAPDGTYLAHYTDSHASGNAPQPDRAEAHALALTIAVSTAFKRACTNLGDQFGLSLYENGQTSAFVKGTLVDMPDAEPPVPQERQAEPSLAAQAFAAEMERISGIEEAGDRIKAVAAAKRSVDQGLLTTVMPGGITLGALADRVAAGQS